MQFTTQVSVTHKDGAQVYSLQGHKLVPAQTYILESFMEIQTGDVCPYDSSYVRYLPPNPQDGFDEYYVLRENITLKQ